MKEKTKHGVEVAKEKTKHGVEVTKEKTKHGLEVTKEKAAAMKEKTKHGVEAAKEKTKHGVEAAKEKFRHLRNHDDGAGDDVAVVVLPHHPSIDTDGEAAAGSGDGAADDDEGARLDREMRIMSPNATDDEDMTPVPAVPMPRGSNASSTGGDGDTEVDPPKHAGSGAISRLAAAGASAKQKASLWAQRQRRKRSKSSPRRVRSPGGRTYAEDRVAGASAADAAPAATVAAAAAPGESKAVASRSWLARLRARATKKRTTVPAHRASSSSEQLGLESEDDARPMWTGFKSSTDDGQRPHRSSSSSSGGNDQPRKASVMSSAGAAALMTSAFAEPGRSSSSETSRGSTGNALLTRALSAVLPEGGADGDERLRDDTISSIADEDAAEFAVGAEREQRGTRGYDASQEMYVASPDAVPPTRVETVQAVAELRSGVLPEDEEFLAYTRSGFVGRDWLIDQDLEHFRLQAVPAGDPVGVDASLRAVLITASAGWGKTSLLAQLLHTHPERVAAYHFCRVTDSDSVVAARFVRRLAATLAASLPAYEAMLTRPDVWRALRKTSCALNATGAFRHGIAEPLNLIPPPRQPLFLLLDALDESLPPLRSEHLVHHAQTKEMLGIVSIMPILMPTWLRIVVTARPLEPRVTQTLGTWRRMHLLDEDTRNMADVVLAQEDMLARAGSSKISESGAAVLRARVQGDRNMLCAHVATSLLLHGILRPGKLRRVPSNEEALPMLLYTYIALCFRTEELYAPARALLAVLVAAFEPLSLPQLSRAAQVPLQQVRSDVSILRPLLRVADDGIGVSFRHRALVDWLQSTQARFTAYWVNGKLGHELLAAEGVRQVHQDVQNVGGYYMRHLVHHAALARKHRTVSGIVCNLTWLQRKLAVTDSAALWQDMAFYLAGGLMVPGRRDISLLRNALRLSATALDADPAELPVQLLARIQSAPRLGEATRRLLRACSAPQSTLWLHPFCVWYEEEAFTDWTLLLPRPSPKQVDEPDRQLAVSTEDPRVPKRLMRDMWVTCMDLSQSGLLLVVGRFDTTFQVWNTRSCEAQHTYHGHRGPVSGVAFARDASVIVSAGWDASVRVTETVTGKVLHSFRYHKGFVNAVTVLGDTVMTGGDDHFAYTCQLESGRVSPVTKHASYVRAVAGNEAWHATGSWDNTIRVTVAGKTDLHVSLSQHRDAITFVTLNGDLLLSGSFDRTLRLWNVRRGKLHRTWYLDSIPRGGVFAPHAEAVISVADSGGMQVWDIRGGMLTSWHGDRPLTTIACRRSSLSGTVLCVGDRAGHVMFFELVDPGQRPIRPPAWQPDASSSECTRCSQQFTALNRRHHCRHCGLLFDGDCSASSVPIPQLGWHRDVRVCVGCALILRSCTDPAPVDHYRPGGVEADAHDSAAEAIPETFIAKDLVEV